MAALYERVLTLVPVDELRDSYNDVLKEEISSINRGVNDVSAAFAKLEELRDVVNRLEQDKTLAGSRSAGLMEMLNSTAELQEVLDERVILVVKVMGKDLERPKKRKNGNEDDAGSKHDEVDRRNSAGNTGIYSRRCEDSKRDDEREGTKLEAGNSDTVFLYDPSCDLEKFVQEVDSLLLHEKIRHLPRVIRALDGAMKRDACVILRAQVMSSMPFVVSWAKELGGQGQPLNMYRDFASTAAMYADRLSASEEKTNIQRTIKDDLLYILDYMGDWGEVREHPQRSTRAENVDADGVQLPYVLDNSNERCATSSCDDEYVLFLTCQFVKSNHLSRACQRSPTIEMAKMLAESHLRSVRGVLGKITLVRSYDVATLPARLARSLIVHGECC